MRATARDDEYGYICPRCAGPKTKQALHCRVCYFELVAAPPRVQLPPKRCACGRPMWRRSKRCRACYVADPQNPPAPLDHPWRKAETLRLLKASTGRVLAGRIAV